MGNNARQTAGGTEAGRAVFIPHAGYAVLAGMAVIYEKYMQEVWDMKAKVYNDYRNSGKASYIEFLKEE